MHFNTSRFFFQRSWFPKTIRNFICTSFLILSAPSQADRLDCGPSSKHLNEMKTAVKRGDAAEAGRLAKLHVAICGVGNETEAERDRKYSVRHPFNE
jgi:hypothetical protein